MMLLVIKGTVEEAMKVAKARGVHIIGISGYAERWNETRAYAPESAYAAVAAWLGEGPTKPPFPVGSLLLFNFLKGNKPDPRYHRNDPPASRPAKVRLSPSRLYEIHLHHVSRGEYAVEVWRVPQGTMLFRKVFNTQGSAVQFYNACDPDVWPGERPGLKGTQRQLFRGSNPGREDMLHVRVLRRDPDGSILSEGPDTWAHRVGFLQPGVKWLDLHPQNKRDLVLSWKRHGGGSGKYSNPPHIPGAPVIYGRTESIRMTKTSGPYKGQRFVHRFGPGVRQHGLPPGTRLLIPAGKKGFRAVELTKKTVLLERPRHNLWNRYK